jgi:hypothetical protein
VKHPVSLRYMGVTRNFKYPTFYYSIKLELDKCYEFDPSKKIDIIVGVNNSLESKSNYKQSVELKVTAIRACS